MVMEVVGRWLTADTAWAEMTRVIKSSLSHCHRHSQLIFIELSPSARHYSRLWLSSRFLVFTSKCLAVPGLRGEGLTMDGRLLAWLRADTE